MPEKKLNPPVNIWDNLSDHLEPIEMGKGGSGVWASISILPGGIWQDAENETVMLQRKGGFKANLWEDSNEETILLGREAAKNIWNQVTEQMDDTIMRGNEPQNIWMEIEDETRLLGRPEQVLWQSPKIRDMSKFKPMRNVGWALKRLETTKGDEYWILKHLKKDTYLRLNAQQVFLWELMDGSASVQDMAISMFLKYKTLSVDSLFKFVEQLHSLGFLVEEKVDVYGTVEKSLKRSRPIYWLQQLGQTLIKSEFSLKNIDKFYERVYLLGGRLLFSRIAVGLMVLICLAGLPAFIYVTLSGDYSIVKGGGSSFGWGVVGLFFAQGVAIFTHESAHALATKHYGRTVLRGGAGFYMGMIAFFMDTTDIWMEPRKPRLVVTWAGPFSGFILGSFASLALLALPASPALGFVYQFAFFCIYMTIVNLNPLLKLDGYFMLMDWLEMPMLREKSIAFVRKELWGKLTSRTKLSTEERIYAIFGVLSLAWTVIFIIMVVRLYGAKVIGFIQGIFGI